MELSLLQYDPIITCLIFQIIEIKDNNILPNIYLTHKNSFHRLLNDPYILNELSHSFDFKIEIDNFNKFYKAYCINILGYPSQFGIGYIWSDIRFFKQISDDLLWNTVSKMCWLNKLSHVQKSRKIDYDVIDHCPINKSHIILRYKSFDGSISWSRDYYDSIMDDIYLPPRKLFNFIVDLYDELENN